LQLSLQLIFLFVLKASAQLFFPTKNRRVQKQNGFLLFSKHGIRVREEFYAYAILWINWTPPLPSTQREERLRERERIPESVFLNLLRSPGIDSQPGRLVWYDNSIYRTGPPGYIFSRNRFLRIDSWAT
jgi:hypothetical protein